MAEHELRAQIHTTFGLKHFLHFLHDHSSHPHQSQLLEVIMRDARRFQTRNILDVSKNEK
jgi:hypothetical protein